MKYLISFLALCATAFSATQYETPHSTSGSVTPQDHVTPGAGPRVSHGIDAFITGDFIYWTARMEGLAYVITGIGDQISSVGRGSTKYPDWSWKPGFKAGIGLNLPHDEWDIYAQYTWYYSSASDTTNSRGNGMLAPWNVSDILSLIPNNESIQQARGAWDIHFSTIDVGLGRNYFISRFLTLRPSIGFKGGWIDQDYSVRYNLSTSNLTSVLKMKNDHDYWGIGLRAGLKPKIHVDDAIILLEAIAGEKKSVNGYVRTHGKGRICHLANGHQRAMLENAEMQKLITNAALWCSGIEK